jgi:GNAT superfamily N-acetyltransferase
MPQSPIPFDPTHIEQAASLLAERHRRDRLQAPELSARFEDARSAGEALQAAYDEPRTSGVAVLRDGRLAGYMLGSVTLPAPGTLLASYVGPRAGTVLRPGHAAEPDDARELYRAMYAAVAPGLVAAGSFSHYVELPAADRVARDAWRSLGFGHESTFGIRSTDTRSAPSAGNIHIRRAGPDDLGMVLPMLERLDRHHARTPFFRPYLPEHERALRARHIEMLADPANLYWLAERDGRALGFQMYVPMTASIDAPAGCMNLNEAYTAPEARGSGVGTALLNHGLDYLRSAGYDHCIVDWVAPNLSGARFWTRAGFRPLTCWLVRQIDPRIAWASGRA